MNFSRHVYAGIFSAIICCSIEAATPTEGARPALKQPVTIYETRDNYGVNFGARGDVLYMNYAFPEVTYASSVDYQGGNVVATILPAKNEERVGLDIAINSTMCGNPQYAFELGWFHIVPRWSGSVISFTLKPSHIIGADTIVPGTGTNTAKLQLDFLHWTISKPLALGEFFNFSPTVGLLLGGMKSKNLASFTTRESLSTLTSTTHIDLLQNIHYQGMGLTLGTGYGFHIWQGLKLMGQLSANMLYGFSKAKMEITSNAFTPSAMQPAHNITTYGHHHGMTFLDSLVGLDWSQNFHRDTLFLNLHAGWRVQAFYPGWIEIESEANNAITERSLFGQGLQAGATLKF